LSNPYHKGSDPGGGQFTFGLAAWFAFDLRRNTPEGACFRSNNEEANLARELHEARELRANDVIE